MKKTNPVEIAIFTALVYVATIAFQLYQPATGGYFNLGESIIYLAALISGPYTAAIAGGLGASLADATTGYGIFAPGTLVIKFIEGFLAGFLFQKLKIITPRYIGISSGILYGLLISLLGITYLSGTIYLGTAWSGITTTIPVYLWIIIGLVTFLGITTYSIKGKHTTEAISLFTAGLTMVLGYFIYEYAISNPLIGRPRIAALFEIPVNIGQVVIGAAIALSIYGFLKKAGYIKTLSQ